MSSPEGSPERKLIVGRPLSLQTQGGSVNLAFDQEDDMSNTHTTSSSHSAAAPRSVQYTMYSPLSEDGRYPQSPDGSIYSERSQAQLIRAPIAGNHTRHHGTTASYSINVGSDSAYKDDFVMEKNASVVSHDSFNDDAASNNIETEEKIYRVFLQMLGPFIASGFGTVAAGLLLMAVLEWENFKEIPELVTLVPVLLGLKGNLEMTLTARLCTAANMGNVDHTKELWQHVSGNLVVTQLQAIVVSSLASIISVVIYVCTGNKFVLGNSFVLLSSALVTASVASLVLGLLMSAIVILSRRFNLNPDNVSAPIAASLGDILTLALLSYISAFFYSFRHHTWLSPLVIFQFLALVPLWCCIAYKNPTVRAVVVTGWYPILCAMMISVGAGQILDLATHCYKLMAVFQPVIAGVGGNLVVVQTCRMTTLLGRRSQLGHHPEDDNSIIISPISALFGRTYLSRTARLLLLVTVPGHTLFVYVIHLALPDVTVTPLFMFFYLTSAVVQVAILLYMARGLVYALWAWGVDPDNAAVPILTAVGDLLGSGFLAASLVFLYQIGDRSSLMTEKCMDHVNDTISTTTFTPALF